MSANESLPKTPLLPARPRLPALSVPEQQRYARHMVLPEVGSLGQQRLKASSVLVVGAGGLGSPVAMYLAAAGVGHLGLVDDDVVDTSNLHRQIMHGEATLGHKKVASAKARLLDLNPHIRITEHETRLTRANALDILSAYDVVADGTDNFATRYLIGDACVLLGKVNVYASILRFEGQVSVFDARRGPCYRCLFPEPPPPGAVPSCAEGGVLGVLPGVIGTLQATETLKILLGIGEPLMGRLMLYDALAARFRELKLEKDPACRLCGQAATIKELVDYEILCGTPAQNPSNLADTELNMSLEISVQDLDQRLKTPNNNIELVDVREPHEWDTGHIAGAKHIPLGQLPQRISELNKDRNIVFYCKSGARSLRAVHVAQAAGIQGTLNLRGGIMSWSNEIDPSVRF